MPATAPTASFTGRGNFFGFFPLALALALVLSGSSGDFGAGGDIEDR